jgi:hypothetical protein
MDRSDKSAVEELQKKLSLVHSELEAIDGERRDGKFIVSGTTDIEPGQDHLLSVLNESYLADYAKFKGNDEEVKVYQYEISKLLDSTRTPRIQFVCNYNRLY